MDKLISRLEEKKNEIEGDKYKVFSYYNHEGLVEKLKTLDGPLKGMRIALKDNILSKDMETSAGSKALKGFKSPYNSFIVDRLEEAGGLIVGKTNIPELAYGSDSENSINGPSINPFDKDRRIRGSSAANGLALVLDYADLAIGSDTGGADRLTAGDLGLLAYKPSYGLISKLGLISLADSLDNIGIIGKNFQDIIKVSKELMVFEDKDSSLYEDNEKVGEEIYSLLDGPVSIEGKKFFIAKEVFDEIDPKLAEVLKETIKKIEEAGGQVDMAELKYLKYSSQVFNIILDGEFSSNSARIDGLNYGYRTEDYLDYNELYTKTRQESLSYKVREGILFGTFILSKHGRKYYSQAMKLRRLMKEEWEKLVKKYDFMVLPNTSDLAGSLGQEVEDPFKFTSYANLLGLPSISLAMGDYEGIPLAIQIIGDRFKDRQVLEVGITLEGGR